MCLQARICAHQTVFVFLPEVIFGNLRRGFPVYQRCKYQKIKHNKNINLLLNQSGKKSKTFSKEDCESHENWFKHCSSDHQLISKLLTISSYDLYSTDIWRKKAEQKWYFFILSADFVKRSCFSLLCLNAVLPETTGYTIHSVLVYQRVNAFTRQLPNIHIIGTLE